MREPLKILVTGGDGRLGKALGARGCLALGREKLNITDGQIVARTLETEQPDIVINTAAYTAVDAAEDDVLGAIAINRNGAWTIAHRCDHFGIPLIHISTDCVLGDGDPDAPVNEDAAPNPLSVYGRTKSDGETRVLSAHPSAVVVRVSWLFDESDTTFIGKILKAAEGRDTLSIVEEEWGRPTPVGDLADKLIQLAHEMISREFVSRWDIPRILHLGTPDPVSRYDWAEAIFDTSAKLGGPSPALTPVPASAFPTAARRPRGLVLDVSRAEALLGEMPDWRAASDAAVAANLKD